jgi:hypothetical protein
VIGKEENLEFKFKFRIQISNNFNNLGTALRRHPSRMDGMLRSLAEGCMRA